MEPLSGERSYGEESATFDPGSFAWRTSPELQLTPILTGALEAFSVHGYHGTTVRLIAKNVGVTMPTLYYHHENKEAILAALLDRGIEHLTHLATAAVTQAESTTDRFLDLVESVVLYMTNSGRLALLHSEARFMSVDLRRGYTAKRGEVETLFVDTIQAGQDEGLFNVTSAKDTARAMLGMLQAIATWYHAGHEVEVTELATRYRDIAAHTTGGTPAVFARV